MKITLPLIIALSASLSACGHGALKNTKEKVPSALPKDWRVSQEQLLESTAHPNHVSRNLRQTAYAKPPKDDVDVTSLWSSSPQSLFGDRRASQIGDLLTVVIEIDDEAEISNSVDQTRDVEQDLSANGFFGLPELINKSLPEGASLSNAIDVERESSVSGSGNIRREEQITLSLAAQVLEIMPNGYLKVAGKQEIIVNNEVRYLVVSGLIRTQDISRLNTITYDRIANARIFYGGRGQLSRAVREGYGNRTLGTILPF